MKLPLNLVALTLAGALLAACTSDPDLYVVPKTDPVEQLRISYNSVALREVSMPTYAASQEIQVADEAGKLTTTPNSLWADEGDRAVTLHLVRALSEVTAARVASDPWPFLNRPEVTLDVRFEEFVAATNGTFTLRGMYFVAPEDVNRADRARSFEISETYSAAEGIPAIAAARAAALGKLARDIATRGLR
ncbi:PqiC family protein [Tritonibacter horizontis]|uniref:ABC-type transport auxiliary lipoprotein component domain-containing protein n=1 Tax=Tritonibacter horizontis TaxID=1768241 RepID=A0A132BYM4_9RHOB|nr:ABC-type transport auxiliary lipoprotein family protein [Tritonibacter horizontis]KUP93276.1 hypothetical protein TRIHO_17720 [Tritonibacter horizontis]